MSASTTPVEKLAPAGRIWQTGLLAGGVAAIGNLIVYFIAQALGVNFNFITPPAGTTAPPFALAVVMASLIGVLLATLVFWLMPRLTQRPITIYRIVAVVALVLSFAQPFSLNMGMIPGAGPVGIETIIALNLMHLVAGVSAIYFLTTRARA
jgi:hypothetical protein